LRDNQTVPTEVLKVYRRRKNRLFRQITKQPHYQLTGFSLVQVDLNFIYYPTMIHFQISKTAVENLHKPRSGHRASRDSASRQNDV
jgi:hypothetical protein